MLNKNSPAVAVEDSEPPTEDKRVVIVKNYNLLYINVYVLKEGIKLQGINQLFLKEV